MCEIAVLDPEQTSIEITQQLAATFHEEQGDGVGVLVIKDDGEKYEYESYKSTTPHWQTLYSFLNREWDDAWRVVVHGRYGTSGGVKRSAAHPIEVDCGECEFDYVIHNGSVRNWQQQRASLISHGHDFTGTVDTEVIPHKIGEIPETTDGLDYKTYNIRGKLNYLLFSEDGIFVRATHKYDLTEDFRMTCRYMDIKDHGFDRGNVRWLIARPGEEIDAAESKYTSSTSVHTSASKYQNTRGHGAAVQQGARKWRADLEHGGDEGNESTDDTDQQETRGTESDDNVVVSYTDLMSTYDNVRAIKVAPGTLKMFNDDNDDMTLIHRHTNPRLYYFYSPEPVPDGVTIDELEQAADGYKNPVKEIIAAAGETKYDTVTDDDTQQQSLDDVDTAAEEEALAESKRATASVVADIAPENGSVEEPTIENSPNADISEGLKQLFDNADA